MRIVNFETYLLWNRIPSIGMPPPFPHPLAFAFQFLPLLVLLLLVLILFTAISIIIFMFLAGAVIPLLYACFQTYTDLVQLFWCLGVILALPASLLNAFVFTSMLRIRFRATAEISSKTDSTGNPPPALLHLSIILTFIFF